jgi:hypothetical protein
MAITSRHAPRRRKSPRVNDILLGSNPTSTSRWTQRTGRHADIARVGCMDEGDWTVSRHLRDIGTGTVGWFARFGEGGAPPLAGFMICAGRPRWDPNDCEWIVRGHLHSWSRALWVPGAAIDAAGWPARRSPWGSTSVLQFGNGEQLTPDLVRVLLSVLPARSRRDIALEYREITGSAPWWGDGRTSTH